MVSEKVLTETRVGFPEDPQGMELNRGKGIYPLAACWHGEAAILGLVSRSQSITQLILLCCLL